MAVRKEKDRFYRVRGDSGQRRRITVIAIVLGIAAFLPLLGRLYSLMVADYDYYAKLALDNQTRILIFPSINVVLMREDIISLLDLFAREADKEEPAEEEAAQEEAVQVEMAEGETTDGE